MSSTGERDANVHVLLEAGRLVDPRGVASSQRTRVLHVIQNLNYGGMERLLAGIVCRIDPERYESHVLVLQYPGRFAKEMDGYAAVHRAPRQHPLSMLWPRALALEIGKIRPDVVHTHGGVWYKASLAARIAGVTLLVHTDHGRHIPDPWSHRFLDGLASRRTDRVIAVSHSLGNHLAEFVVRDASRIRIVLNGVDTARHQPRPDSGRLRKELNIEPNVPIVGSIGRLEPIKGYEIMIEAFAGLLARIHPDGAPPHLVLAGDGSAKESLRGRARTLGISGHVHFLGWRDDISDLHSAFQLFTMSSWSEGTSVSLLEAMSAGVCPIVTDVGGNAAVLGDKLRHRLVSAGDASGLADAWADALVDHPRRRVDAVSARRRVEREYSLDAMVKAHEAIYESRSGS